MKASEIKAALASHYTLPKWSILFEVPDSTGHAGSRRADAVALNLYPSEGLERRAIEIKVSRGDLNSELKDPDKAHAIARFCNSFYLATPKGLTKGAAIPPAWGVLEVSPSGGVRIAKKAQYNETPEPPSAGFLAALLRAATAESARDREEIAGEARKLARVAVEADLKAGLAAQVEVGNLKEAIRFNQAVIDRLKRVIGPDFEWIIRKADFWTAVQALIRIGHVEAAIPDLTRALDGFDAKLVEMRRALAASQVNGEDGA